MVKIKIKEIDKEITYRVLNEKDVEGFIKRKFGGKVRIIKKENRHIVFEKENYIATVLVTTAKEEKRHIERAQIYFADLGEKNDLCLQAGIRPVIVVSNRFCNEYSPVISVISLTTQTKKSIPTHAKIFSTENNNLSCDSTALCEQIISLPKINLKEKIGMLEDYQMKEIEKCMRIQLGIEA